MYTASTPKVAIPDERKIEKKSEIASSEMSFRKIAKIEIKRIGVMETAKNPMRISRMTEREIVAIVRIAPNPKNFPKIIFPRAMGRESVK